MKNELVERFMALFRGNDRSFGQFNSDGKMKTIKNTEITSDIFNKHLSGEVGIGIVPIMDDGFCYFGAIDIDAHGDLPDIDLIKLEIAVRKYDLPLAVCRSKSGGAHLYLFGAEPLKATLVRVALLKWAESLGYGGCEIFPKQDILVRNNDNSQQYGNWINLCYYDAENSEQLRYSIEGGKQVALEYFLDLAESRKTTGTILIERAVSGHDEAPPCIQQMISNSVHMNERNQALYNISIYLKQAFPETWRDKAFDFNAKIFDVPLDHAGAKKTIASVGRRNYRYKCREEPCKNRCNSAVCVTRKFGITPDENNEMAFGKLPEFANLRKITTEPVQWLMAVDDQDITLTTVELMDYRKIREAVTDRLTRLIIPMKNEQWQKTLQLLMQKALIIDAPDEASVPGIMRAKFSSFIQKTDLKSDGKDSKEREILYSGAPVVQIRKDGDKEFRVVYFRGQDFVGYLKKNRCEDLKGSKLWMALRDAGVNYCKLRIGSKSSINVWYVPISDDNLIELDGVKITDEF